MKGRSLLWALTLGWALALGLSACAPAVPGFVPGADRSLGAHIVVELRGQLSLQREGWSAEAPASLGTGPTGTKRGIRWGRAHRPAFPAGEPVNGRIPAGPSSPSRRTPC